MSHVFNGRAFAKAKEETLAHEIRGGESRPTVKAFTFTEDEGSVLYTRLKKQAAERLGISYIPIEHSLKDSTDTIVSEIKAASEDPDVSGLMLQKPKQSLMDAERWNTLVNAIDPIKDVDCLTPHNLELVKAGEPLVLPATVKAVLSILTHAKTELNINDADWKGMKFAVIGRSDIVGKPLFWSLERDHHTELFGKDNLPKSLVEFDVIISATGKPKLITGSQVRDGAILIDVGSPAGDLDFDSLVERAGFITPVPGGVGPVTVASLMENIYQMWYTRN